MDLERFLSNRRPRWARLNELLGRVEAASLAALSTADADEFFELYRLVSSDLSLAQTRTANPALLNYLESLVGRTYAVLVVPPRVRPWNAWWAIIRHRFPARLRAERVALGLATVTFVAGILFGAGATWWVPDTVEIFLAPEHLTEMPSERVARLEAEAAAGEDGIQTVGQQSAFATFLFTHNIRVSVLCFTLGFALGIGTIAVLFLNGAMVGCITVRYAMDGVMTFFVAWVGPHGALELPCIVIAGAAGLIIARAQLRRDRGTFREQMRGLRPVLADILIGAATLLVVAGIIEGGFSQITEPTLPYELKIAVAAALFVGLLLYVLLMPVDPPAPMRENRLGAGLTLPPVKSAAVS
jgi:uncharacterized membrane protein SpoIIM required for sporulation